MRLLRINGTDVDIDEKTALGITLQSYDVKEPGKTFVNISNTFSVPLTSHNSQIFGNVQDVQSISTKAYDELSCDYWQDNEHLLIDSKVRVESIDERINLFAFQKPSIWDTLKGVLWPDFISSFMVWMKSERGLYSSGTPFVGPFSDFISEFAGNTEGIILPMTWSNLYSKTFAGTSEKQEKNDYIYIRATYLNSETSQFEHSEGGHFCIFVKTIFEYIEDTYDVNFLVSGGVLPGNIWDDPVTAKIYIDEKAISTTSSGPNENVSIYFQTITDRDAFAPYSDISNKDGKTLYDFVNSFMQHFNILKDDLFIDGEPVIRLSRFDDLEEIADVVDWSGNISGEPKFKPMLPGYGQNNYIKFSTIFDGGDEFINSKNIHSLNRNADLKKDLFKIDAHVPAVVTQIGFTDIYLDLSTKEAFKTFTFMVNDGLTATTINVRDNSTGVSLNADVTLYKAALYSLDSEYNFLEEIVTYPKFYEIEKWLTLSDIRNFQFFRQYFIRELGGSFFTNKISGFNPDKALKPTKIELIRIGSKTPIPTPDLEIWVDGVGDEFVDGEGDYWI